MRPLRLVGVDCASDPRKVGLAAAELVGDRARVTEVAYGESADHVDRWIVDRLRGAAPALLALDAPLGWPAPLAATLAEHAAGEPPGVQANALFRRRTDDHVHALLGKRPLDVGADRIARCAHAALELLGRVRRALGAELPLAWTPGRLQATACIEVYPAATLASRGIPSRGYKGADGRDARRRIAARCAAALEIPPDAARRAEEVDHVLDAILCVLAGADFARGDVEAPTDASLARREGWIWVRRGSFAPRPQPAPAPAPKPGPAPSRR